MEKHGKRIFIPNRLTFKRGEGVRGLKVSPNREAWVRLTTKI
jgi:hypothetical protein